MKKYDVIVVGGGNGGLAAGAVLAKGGKNVLLIEKSHSPGGFATSFRRGRFEFDVSLHELNGFGRGKEALGGVRVLFDTIGISDKINWVDIPEAYRLISSDENGKIDAVMPFGIENYINKMEEYAPGSRKAAEYIFSCGQQNLRVLAQMSKCKNVFDQIKLLAANRDFLHNSSKSVNEVLSLLDMPQRARNIFKAYWAYLCADCDNLSFFHYLQMVNTYIELGSVIPFMRSLEMTNAMAEVISSNNGDILVNETVTEIVVENGAVKGVKTAGGKEFSADVVVCNASPHSAFSKLIKKEHIPEGDLKRCNFRTFSGSGFCVWLGLNKSAKELGLDNYSYFIFPDADDVKQFKLMGHPDTNRVQNTICPNAAFEGASPEGTSILSMTTLFNSFWWDNVPEEDYFRVKNEFASSMIDTFEKATGIKIREHIEEIEIASPETFARFTLNPHGTIYGYLGKKNDGVLARTLSENKRMSGIKGLYFAGGYGTKMNGYSSAMSTGFDAARHILRTGGKD